MIREKRAVESRAAGPRRAARVLDELFRVPGTNIRFGLDSILGLLPGGGDFAGGALSAYVIVAAARLGAPPSLLVRMGANVLVDTLLGTVPVIGDLFDVAWKANRRNVELLEAFEGAPARTASRNRVVLVLVLGVLLLAAVLAAVVGYRILRWVVLQLQG